MFNLANLFTAANLISGVLAIILALGGRIDLAPFLIFFGAFCDFFDGFAARKLKISGELGKQLDSLADMVTFGVAPGVIMLMMLVQVTSSEFPDGGENMLWAAGEYQRSIQDWLNQLLVHGFSGYELVPLVALFIPFFSMFRLAKFNIDTRQSESFIGVPTPANTLFFMAFPLAWTFQCPETSFYIEMYQILFHPVMLSILIIGMGMLMVSEIPLFSLKFKTFGWSENSIRYVFLLISLGFIVFFKSWSLALIVLLYLILSLIENTILKTKKNEI